MGSASLPAPAVVEPKLAPPAMRAGHLDRHGLLRRLDELSDRKLTLVAAPTGFGKTTTLAAWSRHSAKRIAWVTLDGSDDDPVRFLAHVLIALARAAPPAGTESFEALQVGAAPARAVVPRLLNELEALEAPVVLALDDYHAVHSRACHDLLAQILEGSPVQLSMVLATRADPPLPIGRLRARGDLGELRSHDLRFTRTEAAQLLTKSLGLRLDDASVDRLEQRTEGWPAGLYLAALSLRGREDASAFIDDFAGSNRHVVDYLGAEVLDVQPPALRSFLLRTSILDRLTGSLCDAVLDEQHSGARLAELARSNLFLVPLDDNGEWFRYHRLFAELLRYELLRESPELVPGLHLRAALWQEAAGQLDEAVAHALAAGDPDLAAELLGRSWRPLIQNGHHATLRRLLNSLPVPLVEGSVPLTFVAALLAGFAGAPEREFESLLERIERSGWEGPLPDGTPSAEVAVTHLRTHFLYGDVGRSLEAADRLLELAPDDFVYGSVAKLGRARALYLRGELEEALEALPTFARDGARARPIMSVVALALRSLIVLREGDPDLALSLGREAVELAEELGIAEVSTVGLAFTALGSALSATGQLAEATLRLEHGLDLVATPRYALPRAHALLALAPVRGSTGDLPGARRLLVEARSIIDMASDPGTLRSRLEELEHTLSVRSRRMPSPDDLPTGRELEVLRLFAEGLSQSDVASRLYLSQNTIKSHKRALYRKLGASSRDEAVARGRELGLI